MRVALVVMPFAAADRPSLAVGLLQAALRRNGISCDAKYFNLTFWKLLGSETYRSLAGSSMTPLAGEWVFSQAFYGHRFSTWESYEREVLDDPVWGLGPAERGAIRAARDAAPAFLRLALESNDWGRYDLVGFTSTFQQTLASLCLARRIRARHPEVKIAAGGANFEAGMGRPSLENFEFLDFVATGEADVSFPALCRRLCDAKNGRGERLQVPPGFLFRDQGGVRESPAGAASFVRLDDLATPDYEDYFRVSRATAGGRPPRGGDPTRPWIPVEASRGCWWGQKAHCAFCGLNGETLTFRNKGWRRVVAETDELARRHGAVPLQFADNILAMSYFDDLLPFWAARGGGAEKFFEVKANLCRGQVEMLRAAGVTAVQPGVESLADGTLRVMRKGVSGAQNVALLRWCVESGVRPFWNIIHGFPHESLEDYEHNLAVLGKLTHLPPPAVCALIRLDRFSPHYDRWREHGFTSVAPIVAYRHVFPFGEPTLERLAYYFRYRHPQMDAAIVAGGRMARFVGEWQERHRCGSGGELAVRPHWRGGFALVDSRFGFERRTVRLAESELALVLACDAPTAREAALRRAGSALEKEEGLDQELEPALDGLLASSVVAEVGNRLVTLALLPTPRQLAAETERRPGSAAARLPRAA